MTILIVTILSLTFGLFNYYVPRMVVKVDRRLSKHRSQASEFGLKSETVNFSTVDGLNLVGLVIRTEANRQKGTMILVHGITSHKEHYLPVCKYLAKKGFNSVVFDLRAHGYSEGEYCTFGVKEKQDVSVLLDTLATKISLSTNYDIWGQSLGAAITIQSLAHDKRLKYGIIESAFADSRTIIHDYTQRTLGVNITWLNNYLIWRAERIAGFETDNAVPAQSAKQIQQPVLVVHGKKDNKVKYEYGRENYENIASEDKEFISYDEAKHTNIWTIGGDDYFSKVSIFLDRMADK